MIFFSTYTTIDNIFCIFFWNFSSSLFFLVIFLVQFCIILVRNGMFYIKTKSSNLVTIFYYVIDTVYIYSWKKIEKIWLILVILYVECRFFSVAHGFQLDNGVTSPGIFGRKKLTSLSKCSKFWLLLDRIHTLNHLCGEEWPYIQWQYVGR